MWTVFGPFPFSPTPPLLLYHCSRFQSTLKFYVGASVCRWVRYCIPSTDKTSNTGMTDVGDERLEACKVKRVKGGKWTNEWCFGKLTNVFAGALHAAKRMQHKTRRTGRETVRIVGRTNDRRIYRNLYISLSQVTTIVYFKRSVYWKASLHPQLTQFVEDETKRENGKK